LTTTFVPLPLFSIQNLGGFRCFAGSFQERFSGLFTFNKRGWEKKMCKGGTFCDILGCFFKAPGFLSFYYFLKKISFGDSDWVYPPSQDAIVTTRITCLGNRGIRTTKPNHLKQFLGGKG